MNKEISTGDIPTHNISILGRKTINISGVIKINSFDSEEFLLETSMGLLGIKGKDLEIIKLDTYEGLISIKGIINGFSYLDDIGKKKEEGLVSKLFK